MTDHAMPKHTVEPKQGLNPGAHLPAVNGTPALRATDTVAQAGSAALTANLHQLVARTEALRQDAQDPETLHQLHVALTRFCSTVRLFRLQHRDPRWRAASQQARALAKVVGKARDLDVFCRGALQGVRRTHPSDGALQAFAALARQAQTQARDDCRQALSSPGATRFTLEALSLSKQLVDGGDIAAGVDANAGSDPLLQTPAAPYLQGRLQALWARLQRRLRHAHSARSWHLARLAAKALRHALELTQPVLSHRRRRARALTKLVRLQQRLGQAHDQTVAHKLARRLASASNDPTAAHALALVEGWCVRHRQARLRSKPICRKFSRILEFWQKSPQRRTQRG